MRVNKSFLTIDSETVLFINVIRASLDKNYKPEPVDNNIDWEKLLDIVYRNNMIPLFYTKILELQKQNKISIPYLNVVKRDYLHASCNEMLGNRSLFHILQECRKKQIHIIVFKGIVIANLYPQLNMRFSSDSDLLVKQVEFLRLEETLLQLEYTKIDEKKNVKTYLNTKIMHKIEVHLSIFEDYRGKKIQQLEMMNLTDPKTLQRISINGVEVVTLGHTQHLIYQMFHMIKHFELQGITLRQLVDITLFINRYIDQIDISYFWSCMQKLKYDRFCDYIFTLCSENFNINQKICRKGSIIDEELKVILLNDIIRCGYESNKEKSKWQLLIYLAPYLEGRAPVFLSHLRISLKIYYRYWHQKIILLKKKNKSNNKNMDNMIGNYNIRELSKMVHYRLCLIKKLGLV